MPSANAGDLFAMVPCPIAIAPVVSAMADRWAGGVAVGDAPPERTRSRAARDDAGAASFNRLVGAGKEHGPAGLKQQT
jgi:hypothetical protein